MKLGEGSSLTVSFLKAVIVMYVIEFVFGNVCIRSKFPILFSPRNTGKFSKYCVAPVHRNISD